MSALLEVRNLSKYFKVAAGELHAVENVSFSIEAGKTLGIVGESGCGKSTLGRVILRLNEPTAGHILFRQMDITSFNKSEIRQMRRHMQMIFQDPYASLDPRLTISESIEEPLLVFEPDMDAAARRARVEELMNLVGLSRRNFNAYPHEFDGGRRQRVVIARTLAVNPQFIVCDEPVSALDVSVQAQILNLMIELQQSLKLTYIFISHDLSVVRHISDHVGVMYLGELVEYADRNTIFDSPLHPYTQALLSAIPSVDLDNRRQRVTLKGEITSPINPAPGCRFAPRCPYAEKRCFEASPPRYEVESGHMVACFRMENGHC
ncbi:MAG: ABC transporter ATP-binding protein [Oscillospiraceae bacterium]